MSLRSNRDAIRHGIAYVSEDRQTEGLIMTQSIFDNLLLPIFSQLHNRLGLLDRHEARQRASRLIRELNIKVSDSQLPVQTLSGGNAQRVAIGKWVATR